MWSAALTRTRAAPPQLPELSFVTPLTPRLLFPPWRQRLIARLYRSRIYMLRLMRRLKLDTRRLEPEGATIEEEYLVRVQIPADDVSRILETIINVSPLRYGNFEQVAFRYNAGTQQFKPLEGSISGETELIHVPCDEISFTVPKNDEMIAAVIEAIFESHPYEEPVILIQEVMSTRLKNGPTKGNPNKWWNRPELDWLSGRR